jgi:DNA-binding HxlR family transcriptional regulator
MQVAGVMTPVRGDVFDSQCPARGVLDHITSKWAVLVLVGLRDGPLRYSALRRAIGGVSEKMLAQTLRTLETDGFVHREVVRRKSPSTSQACWTGSAPTSPTFSGRAPRSPVSTRARLRDLAGRGGGTWTATAR